MPRIRGPRALIALAALAALSLATACSTSSAADSPAQGATLRVGFISNTPTPSGPEGWADQHGTLLPALKSAGITALKWLPFKNGPDLSAAVSGGSLDLAILGDTPALTAKANGIDTRLVNQSTVGQDTWLFARKNGPKRLADLKGKTIATQVGSYMYRYLVALLEQKGLSSSVKITHIYTTDAVAALQSGGIAAYAAPAGQLTGLLQQQGYPILDKASVDHRDLLGTSVTVITSNALKAHPRLSAAWNQARAAAVADIAKHASQYYAFAAKATDTTAAVIQASLPTSVYHAAAFTPRGLALLDATDKFLADKKLSKSVVDIDTWKVSASS